MRMDGDKLGMGMLYLVRLFDKVEVSDLGLVIWNRHAIHESTA